MEPADMLAAGERFVTWSERYHLPAPESAVNVVRIVIGVINERDRSALTFEQVARDCGIEPVGARMPDLYTMNEHLMDRYAH